MAIAVFEMFHKNVKILWCSFLSKFCPEPHVFSHHRVRWELCSCTTSETVYKKAPLFKRQHAVLSSD